MPIRRRTRGSPHAGVRSASGRRSRAWLLLLAALGCGELGAPARAGVPADSAAGEVAFELLEPGGGAIVVPAVVNGREPVDLLFDTGATLTCVDEALARELALPEDRRGIAAGIGVGGAGRVRLVRVDSLRVGAASAVGLTVCALDLGQLQRVQPGVRGLLGLNFLRNFRLAIDFERRVIRFAPP